MSGSCLCGAVRFEANGPPLRVNICHCRMCRKASGAPYIAWASFARADVVFSGKAPTLRPSSEMAERGFCGDCGSAMIWQRPPGTKGGSPKIDLALGCFDEADDLAPSEQIWTESRLKWLRLTETLPQRHRGSESPVEPDA
jgi:hypothetical protein